MAEMLHGVEIEASPEKVFEALTTEAGFKGWCTVDGDAKPAVTSLSTFGIFNRASDFERRMEKLRHSGAV
jgi:uncharacterized protein YndB with AHSA1/START domain